MQYTAIVILVLSVNLVLCKEQENSAHARVKRQGWWQDAASALQGLFGYPNQGNGVYPPGMGTGMGPGTGQRQGQTCACSQMRSKRDTKDLEPSDNTYADDDLTRIVGGQPTRQGQYPSIVMILLDGSQHCDGTIINEYHILTAAHCVQGRDDATRFSVVAGAYNTRQQEPGRVTVPVVQASYHPNYNSGGRYNNDCAIMRLGRPLQFSRQIQPACLPRFQRNYDGIPSLVVGWGKTSEGGSSSSVLQHVMLPILGNQQCSNMMEQKYTITNNMLCAGLPQGGKDSCAGDSGGPMYLDGNQGLLQVGIVSFGEGCARQNRPGVYCRVDQVMDFVLANSGIQQGCSAYVM